MKDMEQRCPVLNKQITAAENLKNKSNSPQVRSAITDQSKHKTYLSNHIYYHIIVFLTCCLKIPNLSMLLHFS